MCKDEKRRDASNGVFGAMMKSNPAICEYLFCVPCALVSFSLWAVSGAHVLCLYHNRYTHTVHLSVSRSFFPHASREEAARTKKIGMKRKIHVHASTTQFQLLFTMT